MDRLAMCLEQSARLHRHLCPRQVLGVRMGMLAGDLFGLNLPQADRRLFAFVEIDGCAADSISVATGCWLGRRTLRLMDFGKVAATFVDTHTGAALRIYPHPRSRARAREYAPHARSRWHAQLAAYQMMPDAELLVAQRVDLTLDLDAIISRPGVRVNCEICGEEILNEREVVHEGTVLCRGCIGGTYYTMLKAAGLMEA